MSGVVGWVLAMAMIPASVDPPMALTCKVSGGDRITPPMTTAQICGRLARQMSETLNRPVSFVERETQPAQTIRVDLRIEPRLGAIAVVEAQHEGKWLKSPELSVTAMDAPLNFATIDQLGRDIADYLSYVSK